MSTGKFSRRRTTGIVLSIVIMTAFSIGSLLPLPVLGDDLPKIDITVDKEKTIGINNLSLGFQLHGNNIERWGDNSELRELAKEAGFKLVRVFDYNLRPCIRWNESTQSGVWNWSETDIFLKKVFEIGAEPLINLGYYDSTIKRLIVPRGMLVGGDGLPQPQSWAKYCEEWVKHFKAENSPVRYYEIVNEPYKYFDWNNITKIAAYTNFWNIVARAMRKESSNILISHDASTIKLVLDYWLAKGDPLDFLDFHKYDSPMFEKDVSDSGVLRMAESYWIGESESIYSIDQAREKWQLTRGTTLPVILGETNLSYKYDDGTDPRIQQIIGAVHTALVIRIGILEGIRFHTYFEFCSPASTELMKPTGGRGFGMVNADNSRPWYPFYINQWFGQNLGIGDRLVQVQSSSDDVRSLGWIHNSRLNVVVICKTNASRAVSILGIVGKLNALKIDDTFLFTEPLVQNGVLSAGEYFTMNGYTVALFQSVDSGILSPFFEDDFDSADFSRWTGTRTSPGDNATVVKAGLYQGGSSARFASDGKEENEYAYSYVSVDLEEVYVRGYFKFTSVLPFEGNDERIYFIKLLSGGDSLTGFGIRRLQTVDSWVLYGRNGSDWGGPFYADSPTMENNRWYCLELHWKKRATYGLVEAYVGGKRIAAIDSLDTTQFGNVSEIRVGLASDIATQESLTVYCDYVAVSRGYVGLLSDFNHDGTVNMKDLAFIAYCFNSLPGTERWNPTLDLNDDQRIDLQDIAFVARDFLVS